MHICPTSLPCSFTGRFPVLSTSHPPSSPQGWLSPCLKRRHLPRESPCGSGPEEAPDASHLGRSGPTLSQAPKMSHYSSENNIWYITHIWHHFPSHAAGLCHIKSVELQWCKACISKVRIRPLSVLYSLIIWEAEHFSLSAYCPLLTSIWFQWESS